MSPIKSHRFSKVPTAVVGTTSWLILVILGILVGVYAYRYVRPVKPPDDASLTLLLKSVSTDINANKNTFREAGLRIKEATIELNLGAERTEVIESGQKKESIDVRVEATGKGQSSHRLLVVLERNPDQNAKKDSPSSSRDR